MACLREPVTSLCGETVGAEVPPLGAARSWPDLSQRLVLPRSFDLLLRLAGVG